jgi:Icc-related predicted phosphoesterase
MKAFVRHSRERAEAIGLALRGVEADFLVALTHYSPVPETLVGEPPEIYAFLGSHFLADATDSARTDLHIHSHAHAGAEFGTTPGGVPVRNVALPVIRRPYAIYRLGAAATGEDR